MYFFKTKNFFVLLLAFSGISLIKTQEYSQEIINKGKEPVQVPEIKYPNKHCYWVEEGRFLAGKYPISVDKKAHEKDMSKKLDKYLDAGVTCFIDLTEKNEYGQKPYKKLLKEKAEKRQIKIQYHRFAIPDHGTPKPELMREILNTINKALADGYTVYVHCRAGVGRTGITVGCYLRDTGMTGEQALQKIALLRQAIGKTLPSPREKHQQKFVREYNKAS